MRPDRIATAAVAAALLVPAAAPAQMIKLTPKIGGFFRASSVDRIEDEAGNSFDFERKEVSTFAFGVNVEIDLPGSPLGVRGDASVATNTSASLEGTEGDVESSLVAASGGVVLRPLSFLPLLDPYVTGGLGFTSTDYGADEVGELPTDRSFAFHGALGTDVKLGGLRVQGEVADYVSGITDDTEVAHNVFVTVGLGLSVF